MVSSVDVARAFGFSGNHEMIELVFTLDYEIYGNGVGSLRELLYEPAETLKAVFDKRNARLVVFVEAAELEILEANGADGDIELVKQQVRDFHRDGFEIGLHLHPQWYNARLEKGSWLLDYSEYNLCSLPRARIIEIVDRSIAYLRGVLKETDFTPVSFRAGNWLFQPTQTVASVLADRGIRVDSSVFKGGLQHQHGLDYRRALDNGAYWNFSSDVNLADPGGGMLEVPIQARMVPFWKMLTRKRVSLQRKNPVAGGGIRERLARLMDSLRFRYPLKLDYCRMTLSEMAGMVEHAIAEGRKDPATFRPIVAIGHTKDLVDVGAVESFLAFLEKRGIPVSTLAGIAHRCT
jgi:hypothetical protein